MALENEQTPPVQRRDATGARGPDLTHPGAHRLPALKTPVMRVLEDRPPLGPIERLDHDGLVANQQSELSARRRKYTLSSRALFAVMDLVYGKERTLEKFRVLELVARVPYQAWESVAYVAMTHTSKNPDFARRVYDRARIARIEQDNEQWHLLILEELTRHQRRPWLRGPHHSPDFGGVVLPAVMDAVRDPAEVELPAQRRLRRSRRARVRTARAGTSRVGDDSVRESVQRRLR